LKEQIAEVIKKLPFNISFFLFIGIVILIAGCKTRRSIIKEPIKTYGEEYLLERLAENELKFNWLSAKMNVSYTEDRITSDFKGQLRIRKDSVIWISFSPALGIEAARIMITQDSIKYMNRINKVYFKGDYDFMNRYLQTDIDFDMLQSIIIGNDFQFYEKTTFRASYDKPDYRLSTTSRRKLKRFVEEVVDERPVLIQNLWLHPETFKITKVDIKEYGRENKKLEAVYSKFIPLEEMLFPSRLIFEVTAEANITIDVDFSRTDLNEPKSFPFTIPSKYERIR
jgi:hypothetical protein